MLTPSDGMAWHVMKATERRLRSCLQPAVPESLDRELLETLNYLMGQVDPVCWPNRRMAREAHQKIRALMKRPKPPENV